MAINLTACAISILSSGKWNEMIGRKPALQVIYLWAIQPQTPHKYNIERYGLLLSDGSYFQQGMLAIHHNELVRSHELQKGSIVQLTEFVCNQIRDHMIIVVVDLNVIMGKCDIIGHPRRFTLELQGNTAATRTIPVTALNPNQGNWTIKARVTVKGEPKRYKYLKGDGGKVFSFDLLDSDGGQIRVFCFNAVVDQFYHQIEVGKVYYISRGSVKPAQKAFNHSTNDYEIILDHSSTVEPCFDDDIHRRQFHFCSIADIEDTDNNIVDVIGLVFGIFPPSSITRGIGFETKRRTLFLSDMSGRRIHLTLWGKFCCIEGQIIQNMCDSGKFPILAVKSVGVYDFNGKSLATISSTKVFIEPDFQEAYDLRTWFNSGGRYKRFVNLTRTDVWKTILQINDETIGSFTVNATICNVKIDNLRYTACPIMIKDQKCRKKVVNIGDGKWRCEECDQTVDECDYRYELQLQIQDHTGLTWVAAASKNSIEEIMGVSARELYSMKHEDHDDDKFTKAVRSVLFNEYSFYLLVTEEFCSDEEQVKSTVIQAEKIKFSSKTKALVMDLKKMHKKVDPSFIAQDLGQLDSIPC